MSYDPLTYRHPRTLAELDEDSRRSWWHSAQFDEAEEERLRSDFDRQTRVLPAHASATEAARGLRGLVALLRTLLR